MLRSQNRLSFLAAAIDDPTSVSVEPPPGDYGAMFFKMLGSLLLLVALLVGTAWILRRLIRHRLTKSNRGQAINILERRVLSPKTMLYLVEVEHRKVLIAESHLEVRRLHVVTEETPPHPAE